jgi:hypothetical protein
VCHIRLSTNGARRRDWNKLMACGGCKTPPHTHTPFVMCSFSNTNVTLETKTTSNNNPHIPIEPVTPIPQGIGIQEIICQSLIRNHNALAHIKQPSRPLNQPLDFMDIQEKLQGSSLPKNPLGGNTTNPTKMLIPGAGGSGIPPSPPSSSPSSLRGEYSDEGSSSYETS